jgi:peptide methionine sulfoxide reductase msrA/msrB
MIFMKSEKVESIIKLKRIKKEKESERQKKAKTKTAIFAGGCFWCMQAGFENVNGVIRTISGYTGGTKENPSYEQVLKENTGHFEAVEVFYNPLETDFKTLLDVFWKLIDPTDPNGQFSDRGPQYRTAIFYKDNNEKKIAEKSKLEISRMFDKPIATLILKFDKFYLAETYHQEYHKKQKIRYKTYENLSGRKEFVEENKKRFKEKKQKEVVLTPMQYEVTKLGATEKAFENEYWDNHEEGIYVDIISGEPLFSSKDKYDSCTGWPSFTKPIDKDNIIEKKDFSFGTARIEVKGKKSGSHLGHVFKDGPKPTGLRYCMNSSALRFIPKKNLIEEGYDEFIDLFE